MVLVLVACGSSSDNQGDDNNNNDGNNTPPTAQGKDITLIATNAAWIAVQDGGSNIAWEVVLQQPNAQAETLPPALETELQNLQEYGGDEQAVLAKFYADNLATQQTATEKVINISSDRFGVARVCINKDSQGKVYQYEVDYYYYATNEVTQLYVACSSFSSGSTLTPYTVSGSVMPLAANETATVAMSYRDIEVTKDKPNYSFEWYGSSTYDILATKTIGRNEAVSQLLWLDPKQIDSDTVLNIDFTNALKLSPKTITVNNTKGQNYYGEVELNTDNNSRIKLGRTQNSDNTFSYGAVPASKLTNQNTYLRTYASLCDSTTSSSVTKCASHNKYFTTANALSLNIPDFLESGSINTSGGKVKFSWSSYPDANNYYIRYNQYYTPIRRYVDVRLSDGYLGNASDYAFTLPDLGSLQGWQGDWNSDSTARKSWSINTLKSSGDFSERNYDSYSVSVSGELNRD